MNKIVKFSVSFLGLVFTGWVLGLGLAMFFPDFFSWLAPVSSNDLRTHSFGSIVLIVFCFLFIPAGFLFLLIKRVQAVWNFFKKDKK
jgi:hypothetical protein